MFLHIQPKRMLRNLLLPGCLLLAFLMVACGGGTTGPTSPTPTTGSNPPAAPEATPSPTPGSPTADLKTYQGSGYSIGYPATWQQSHQAQNGADITIFKGSNGPTLLVSNNPDPGGVVPADTISTALLNAIMQNATNVKAVNVPSSVTLAGATWNQKAETADITSGGQTKNVKVFILTTMRPLNAPDTKVFEIIYLDAADTFDQTNTTAFQPMLQSFQFAG